VLNRGLAIRDAFGDATRMAGSLSDITDRRRVEDQLHHDAMHDALTGLPNRALFTDLLNHAIKRSTREPGMGCAVLFLDIDRFKLVNDSFSHAIGDRLLEVCAQRISEVLRPGDTVARLGGDEFTVLIEDVGPDPVDAAMLVAERIQCSLGEGFDIEEHRLAMTASIGIAVGDPASTGADVLRNADIAMYEAKRRARGSSAVFDVSMHRKVTDRMSQESDLRQVLGEGLIDVHYQPVIELATGRVHGFEALARWPDGWPPVSPNEFVPIAEETGLIGLLGLQVLHRALNALAAWRSAGMVADDVRMSVNVSAGQLDDHRFPEDVLDALETAQIPPSLLRLEITEGTLMREPERMLRIVTELCAKGVGLELDDFGTGYSSLAALRQFPVNALKVDRSFVNNLTEDVDSEVIVRSTIALGHSLGLSVIAEGIEHAGQLHRLRALGCEYGQGFLFSRPLTSSALEAVLAQWSPSSVAALADSVPGASRKSYARP
jgi:diguanylate cyclase (GGDEF)-like protein